jgi:hypothetical protein
MLDFFKNCNRKQDEHPIQIIVQGVGKDELTDALTEAMLRVEEEKERKRIETKKVEEEAKEQERNKFSFINQAFSFWISIVFRILSPLCILLSLFVFGFSIYFAINIAEWVSWTNWIPNITGIVFLLVFVAFLFVYGIILWKAGKEIEREKDRNYTIAVFSGIVSLAALIIAFLSYIKEVG